MTLKYLGGFAVGLLKYWRLFLIYSLKALARDKLRA